MKKYLENVKSITVNLDILISSLQALKKQQKKATLNIDYNTRTIYINGKGIQYTIEGF